jgi:hypothetical protein
MEEEDKEGFEVPQQKDSGDHADNEKKKQKKGKKDKALQEEMAKVVSVGDAPKAEKEKDEGEHKKKKGKHSKKGDKGKKDVEEKPKEDEKKPKEDKKPKEEEKQEEKKPVEKAEAPKEEEKGKEEEKEEAQEEKKRPKDPRMPVEVLYCGICNQPLEYCSLSEEKENCKAWAFKNAPAIYAKLYGEAAPVIEEVKKDTEEDKSQAKKKKKKVTIQDEKQIKVSRISRGKSNYITQVYGMHFFGKNFLY